MEYNNQVNTCLHAGIQEEEGGALRAKGRAKFNADCCQEKLKEINISLEMKLVFATLLLLTHYYIL